MFIKGVFFDKLSNLLMDQLDRTICLAINVGDMEFIQDHICQANDASRPLLPSVELYFEKEHKVPFQYIRGASAFVLSILFQKPEILNYFLTNFSLNLTEYSENGWAPIHFSACVEDYHCMELLLQQKVIQKNIDFPILNKIQQPIPKGCFTTALHIAVTHKRHAQAILLTTEFPQIMDSLNSNENPSYDESKYQTANAAQMSAFGNTPLHIAAYLNDWDMCQIILNATDDNMVVNLKGETAIDIAKKKKFFDLAKKLEENQYEPISVLRRKYIKDDDEIEESNSELEINIEERNSKDEKIKELGNTIEHLTNLVQQLSTQVTKLEEERDKKSKESVSVCSMCGSPLEHGSCPICDLSDSSSSSST